MHLTVQALVLRATPYKDTDMILTLLSSSHGKLTVKARGLRRRNNPMVAACQLLTYSEFSLFEYRGMYTVNEARTIEIFSNLRRDILKLSLGTYFAQVAEVVGQEDAPDTELQSLLLNCLFAMSSLNIPNPRVKSVFELRCACIAGYQPDLHGCYRCGDTMPDRFNIAEGRLECIPCRDPESRGIRLPVTAGAVEAMRFICFCDLKRIFSFQVGEESFDSLAQISESYLSTQLERGFSSLDFYKSLLVQV